MTQTKNNPQNSDENKCSCFGRERAARFGKLGQKTNDEATDEVDGQRAVGEVNAFAEGLGPRAEQVTGYRSQCAAEGDVDDR